ncbi:glycosyl hydrolase family 2 immunoglobulin-like beta-sandwich domain protein (macronuclear) [Tetrahymena thermophila SB210]|uniref:Beta-mannosidase B n=1 Tax=Tetrahymena thermophila (strain SB210) TaxID=312017 RepID=I7MFA0_TETTS|nr:glycosyl hydrolase family 2 immunoglobulin-like beta-sandwich domain protein [Tetrahymena thermophila SB210]EAR99535.2 glycosyl hydrolase family 2 immunoglobulin-like beta-sandwich domain protein [Tetrahymena thermophila SB210]|eukprot:XP_001019780.2 glycosyl hydrolase family 2 immunoglobulin-like beta-sandwich domain protein [Tetrahymena thermophila SB210]
MNLPKLQGILLVLLLCGSLSAAHIINLNTTQWYFKEYTNQVTLYSSFMKANIPSTVHLDLLDNKIVPDPYFRDNLLQFYSLEEKDWVYKTNFDGKSILQEYIKNNFTEIQLIFEGLDTHADVYLNGNLILKANNMFRRWVIHDLQEKVQKGDNSLEIIFWSAVNHDLEKEKQNEIHLPYNYTYSRKAAYQYGWDWGPRLVTCGIWKDAYFRFVNKAEILSTHIRTLKLDNVDISTGKADAILKVDVEISAQVQSEFESVLSIYRDNHLVHEDQYPIRGGNQTISTYLSMQNANLWWCQGMGKPHLYHYTVILREKSEHKSELQQQEEEYSTLHHNHHHHKHSKGQILSQQTLRTGIRQIKVDQRHDKHGNGTSFAFYLNGYYLFAKGGNYIPPDMFMPRALKNPQVYHKTIQDAVKANHNMIRLWGGGQFEYDIFYDLCDENGLLIWHDLMFACAMYPADKDILFNIEQEMIENVKRLRNHPSIGVWNGNNEVKIGWDLWGWQDNMTEVQKEIVWGWYLDIFNVTLRNVLDQEDPDVYYWPTSPSSEVNFVYQVNTGDIHFWNVWASGAPIEEYDDFVGRFNSEYGMQGILAYESIKKFTIEEDRTQVNTTVMEIHERHVKGYPLISQYLQQYFLEPTDYKDYIYVSQVNQAYAIQTAILALRRNKPYNSGSLYWQINDVWPVVSWASVDFYGNWKALHFRQQHLYQNVIVAVEKNGTNYNQGISNSTSSQYLYNVRIVNDLHKKVKGQLTVNLINQFGSIISHLFEDEVTVRPNSNHIFLQVDLNRYQQQLNSTALYLNFQYKDQTWEYVHYFVIPQKFEFSEVQSVDIKSIGKDGIQVQADTLVRDFYVYCSDDTEIKHISKNYFDLVPFQKYHLKFPHNGGCKQYSYKTLNNIMLQKETNSTTSHIQPLNNFQKSEQ